MIDTLTRNWNQLADSDPLFAILTQDGKEGLKWGYDEFFKTGKEEIQDLINQIRKLGVEFHSKSVLDFGCGVGRNSQAFAKYFEKVVGVDISDRMIEMAINYNSKSNVEYYVNQSDNLSIFENEQFDLIYSNIVLQHIPKKLTISYLREFSRVLKMNGLLIFQLPDKMINPVLNLLWNNDFTHTILYPVFQKFRNEVKAKSGLHPISKNQVLKILASSELKYLSDLQNGNSGPRWVSRTYFASK